jgi:hypothetical protein
MRLRRGTGWSLGCKAARPAQVRASPPGPTRGSPSPLREGFRQASPSLLHRIPATSGLARRLAASIFPA